MDPVYKITYSIRDGKKKQSRVILYVSIRVIENPSYDAVEVYAQYMAELLDFVITGRIVDININRRVPLPASLKLLANNDADVEQGIVVSYSGYNQFQNAKLFEHRIPTFDEQYIEADGSIRFAFIPAPTTTVTLGFTGGNFFGQIGQQLEDNSSFADLDNTDARGDFLRYPIEGREDFKSSKKG